MVHAVETSLRELLEGTRQYVVPLYQRTYSWGPEQLRRLWEDVATLAADRAADPSATHFIGSLVLAPGGANGPAGVQRFLVVDGQQRLTTLSLLLCALRDHRAEHEAPVHRERVNAQYLVNSWHEGEARPKLLPTQTDRTGYLACLDGRDAADDPVSRAYRFFLGRLAAPATEDDAAPDAAAVEDAVIGGLSVVSVTARDGDNVHRIFESLNNTGLSLTQADLLRNDVFMRLPTLGDEVYAAVWRPMQERLGEHLETLFWIDLLRDDPRARRTEVYVGHHRRLERMRTEEEVRADVLRLADLADLLLLVVDPARESDPAVRRGLERLEAWGSTTVRPLLLQLLRRRREGTADGAQLARAMTYLEAFLVRRLLVGHPATGLNRTVLETVAVVEGAAAVDEALHRHLSTGRKHYATDAEVRRAAAEQPFYRSGRADQRRLVMRWLEEDLRPKERVDTTDLTIEHVLPQTLSAPWRQALTGGAGPDQDVDALHAALVDTLGNLTLTGYNSEMGNASFEEKRPRLAASGVALSTGIAASPTWGRDEILARAADLAERAVLLWPGPAAVAAPPQLPAVPAAERWPLMDRILEAIPPGRWTSYGDLAEAIGSHPVPVGVRLADHPAPNPHRVLQVEGTVSPGFRWREPGRRDDPVVMLRDEGVAFDRHGHADQSLRVTARELLRLVGEAGPAA